MAGKMLRVVHYLNQFFGQIGGEDKADNGFLLKQGPVGPGMALQNELSDNGEIVATVICGDNYFSKDAEKSAEEGLELIRSYHPDLFFAGPAFEAGRYGVSCGAFCKIVADKLGIPAISGMYDENPGVELYRRYAFICKTGSSARDMIRSIKKMTKLGMELLKKNIESKLVSRENIPNPDNFEYFTRFILRNEYIEKTAAERSVEKLIAKLNGKIFESEIMLPEFEKTDPPPPLKHPENCTIAIVSDGGLVPKGNPHKLSSRGNTRWAMYEFNELLPEESKEIQYEIAHTGYFNVEVMEDPNRLVPIDVLKELEREGKIGKLHPTFFSTSGNATVAKRCMEMGEEIASEIHNREIDAVILTST